MVRAVELLLVQRTAREKVEGHSARVTGKVAKGLYDRKSFAPLY